MLNAMLKKSLHVGLVVLQALIVAILIMWLFDFPVRPAF
jgi:hypothetical protein